MIEQEQDEKVNQASMNNEDVHTSCNVFENEKNIKNNQPLLPKMLKIVTFGKRFVRSKQKFRLNSL